MGKQHHCPRANGSILLTQPALWFSSGPKVPSGVLIIQQISVTNSVNIIFFNQLNSDILKNVSSMRNRKTY